MKMIAKRRNSLVFAAPLATLLAGGLLLCGCAVEAPPPTPVQQYVAGVNQLKAGDQAGAIVTLESAISRKPDLRMAHTVLGQIYRERGDYANAAKQYEALSELDPYTTTNHYHLGVSYQFLRQYAQAIRAYLAGLQVDPTDFKTNMNLGTVLLATGDTDSAVKYLDKATQLDPKSAVAWTNLGVALDARGSYVLAETAYRRAISLEKDAPGVVANLANNLLAQQKVSEATYLWEQVVKTKPTSFNRTKLADAYTAGGEMQSAETLINAVLKTDPRFVPAINAKARLFFRKYELSGFVDDNARKAGLAAAKQSLALNGQQPQVSQLINKYEQALPLK